MTKAAIFAARQNEPCPECGAELVIRSGRHGPFLGCSRYPECQHIRPLKRRPMGTSSRCWTGRNAPNARRRWHCARAVTVCLSVAASIRSAITPKSSINRTKPASAARSVVRANCCSVNHAMVRFSTPAIATLNVSLSSILNPSPVSASTATTRC